MSISHASAICLELCLMLVYITPSLSHGDKKASGSPYWVEERKSPSLHTEESLNGSQLVSCREGLGAEGLYLLR